MGTSYYCDEFKRDLEQQITVRGYLVSEAALRLGVSSRSLYKWLKLFGEPMAKARAGASDRGARYKKTVTGRGPPVRGINGRAALDGLKGRCRLLLVR